MDGEEMTAVLPVRDVFRSAAWYGKLGFEISFDGSSAGERGFPRMIEMRRGSMALRLSEWPGDKPGGGVLQLALRDADDVVREIGTGFDEDNVFDVEDPDGNRLRIVNA